MAGIFKAYDIRGIYGNDLTEDTAARIGRALATFLPCRRVVVGRDIRVHSEPLFRALARGLTEQGADVLDIGLCSTPMCYHANGSLQADASVMITASHNPAPWNGFKLCREHAIPLSGPTGISDIEAIVAAGAFATPPARKGRIVPHDIGPAYVRHVRAMAQLRRPVRIAADFANAMGILEARCFDGLLTVDPLFDNLDGTFPNHEANPLKTATLAGLQARVRRGGYDFGVAFDGDADRVGFVDERGDIVGNDTTTALIAQAMLRREKGVILYDLRSSRAVREVIEESGGTPVMCRVGHAFIKRQMRETDAVFAGELSGHYYFRDNFFTESSAMAVLCVANRLTESGRPLSALVQPLLRYAASGEIDSEVEDPRGVLAALRTKYGDGLVRELDGLSVEFPDWWFNARVSNTEPLLRLNIEAKTRPVMERRRQELLAVIRAGRASAAGA